MMRLRLTTPTERLLDAQVSKIIAEAENGHFCLLPRHIDFVASLVPGLLAYVPAASEGGVGSSEENRENEEIYVAVDRGILVKVGAEVRIATRRAVTGADLGMLRAKVIDEFQALDEVEVKTRSALARLESGFLRRFLEIREADGG